MRVVRSIEGLKLDRDVVLTIGTFDGVHRGHQHLLREIVERARRTCRLSAALSFHPHPRVVLRPVSQPTYLSTPAERAAILASLGLDLLIVLPFSRGLAETPAREFVAGLHRSLRMRELWVGDDFAMGRRREGDIAALGRVSREIGYVLHVVEPLCDGDGPISSTRIRQLLLEGRVRQAARLLGRNYAVVGQVIGGVRRGRRLGFRTANLKLPAERVLPANGVYAVWVTVDHVRLPGVANVGVRPSFDEEDRLLEVHLLDYESELYGQSIQTGFVRRLRAERRFEDTAELSSQIERDIGRARCYLGLGGLAQ